MSGLPNNDVDEIVNRYTDRYEQFGYSPLTLGWNKGRQSLRFAALTSMFPLKGKKILDIGCGFGDLNTILQDKCGRDYDYTGIDLVPDLISEAKRKWQGDNIRFYTGDFLSVPLESDYDVAISSGAFNHQLSEADNYGVIEATIDRTWPRVSIGLAFDFLSTKVEFTHDHTFHSDPAHILEMAYRKTRRVVLRNDYLPFEFAVCMYSDDRVDAETGRYVSSIH